MEQENHFACLWFLATSDCIIVGPLLYDKLIKVHFAKHMIKQNLQSYMVSSHYM